MEVDEAIITLAEVVVLVFTAFIAVNVSTPTKPFSPPPSAMALLGQGEYVYYANSTACLLVNTTGVYRVDCGVVLGAQGP